MDQRDQTLLDKQLRNLRPSSRHEGIMVLAILAVFFGGMAVGGFLFGYSEPTRIALDDSSISVPPIPSPITQQ